MSSSSFRIDGQVIDIQGRRIYPAEVIATNGVITEIRSMAKAAPEFILPGFIDAHVHIESSMLVPSEFARLAVVHGTVATVSDPHEIANVLGVPGVDYMIANGREVPFKFYFGAPSCVPATDFETAGARLGPDAVEYLMKRKEIRYLAEMMNWPGVVHGNREVLEKIAIARKLGKPVDGHAPGLTRSDTEAYARAGISTDHECVSLDEALHKLSLGMKIIIREGSAARNFDALIPLLPEHTDKVMFGSDDKHPDSLVEGHINLLVARAVARGVDVFSVLTAACLNPVRHYGLDVGQLCVGDPADFIVVKDLTSFQILQTYVGGKLVAKDGQSLIPSVRINTPNNFQTHHLRPGDFHVKAISERMRVIAAYDGQLITRSEWCAPGVIDGYAVPVPADDVLKIAVVNRYAPAKPTVGFVKGFGLKEGAIASSVAHDSHNIIVVGADDRSIASAINAIMESKGGIAATRGGEVWVLPLPVAGIMSSSDGYNVAREYQAMDRLAKTMGSKLGAPFMTLSFMALLVIPELKLSDKGLFDGGRFRFCELFGDE